MVRTDDIERVFRMMIDQLKHIGRSCPIFLHRAWPAAVLVVALVAGSPRLEAQTVDVDINVNVKHTVGGISTFDRSKFITIHSSHTESDWDGGQQGAPNFTNDLLDAFIEGYDVYFGRDTGYVSWYLNNNIDQDPSKPGWARVSGSTYSIATQGSNARNSYNSDTSIHPYESRASTDVMAAQFSPFWPDGTLTGRGWALSQTDTPSEPFGSATGNYMGNFLNHFYGSISQVGRPLPKWVEVMNEPDWELFDNGSTPPSTLWKFHNSVANQIRSLNSDVMIGGYCAAFPDLEKNNFQEWQDEWISFIDTCGTNMDFYTLHLYDFEDYVDWYRKGSNLEATLDMIEHYSNIQIGAPLPFVISEFGGRARNLENGPWSAYRDWKTVKSLSSMVMSFMDRPNLIGKIIPFITVKAEWGRGTYPYPWRLMRQANEPASYTGNWVYTEMVKFYQLWSDVNGTRVDVISSDPDIQTDAYVDGNKAYVILNNLTMATQTIDLSLFEDYGNAVQNVFEKNMYWNGSIIALVETLHPGNLAQVLVGAEGTVVLEYTFAAPLNVNHTSDEVKHYASTYFQPIFARDEIFFSIDGVNKGAFGEAVLRLGFGREHYLSKQPLVFFNGTQIAAPTDFMGHEGDDRDLFFGELDIPVPYSLLLPSNTVSVSFADSGGYVSSVSLRAYAFSKDVRGGGAAGSRIYASQLVGSDIILHATNGIPMGLFDVLSSADMLAPISNWATNQAGLQFDAGGAATITNPVSGSQEYFLLQECVGCASPPTNSNVTAIFDFDLGASIWSGNVDSQSTSGDYWFNNAAAVPNKYIMQLATEDSGATDDHLVMYHGGAGDGPHTIESVFTVQDAAAGGGTSQTFTVTSLDFENSAGNTDSHILGYSGGDGGTLEWTVSGVSAGTVSAATTGSFSNPVDTIRWETVGATYYDNVFGAALDSVVISINVP